MPYIEESERLAIDAGRVPFTPGELNYAITQLLRRYFLTRGTSYQTHNDAIGALECAKQELYRRATAPYEDYKISVNGDVY
jgi:hypothetical protein